MNEFNDFDSPRAYNDGSAPTLENFDKLDNMRASRDYRFLKIIAIVLASLLLCWFLKDVFISPLAELNLRTAVAGNCRIRIVAEVLYSSIREETTVKVSRNLFSLDDEKFYELDGDTVYEHYKGFGDTWETKKISKATFEMDIDYSETSALLDTKNYERKKGSLFTWQIKDGVDIGDFRTAELTRKGGKILIIAYAGMTKVTITVDRIGLTRVDTPWK